MEPTTKEDCSKILDLYILCNVSESPYVKKMCNDLNIELSKMNKINNKKTLLEHFIDCNNAIEKRNENNK